MEENKSTVNLGNLVLIIGVLSFVSVIGWAHFKQNNQFGENHPAPNFTLTTFDGEPFNLTDYRGQIVVLNFWGSWCAPCHAEAPDLQRTYEQYAEQNIIFIGITYDENDVADSHEFIAQYGITYANGEDPHARIANSYHITGVPETFIIGRDGKIAHYFPGSITETMLSTVLDSLLMEG